MKVFNVDEMEWYAGESAEDINKFIDKDRGPEVEEREIIELTPIDMTTLKFFMDENDPEEEDNITFQERLDFMIEQKEKFPCLFATSEC